MDKPTLKRIGTVGIITSILIYLIESICFWSKAFSSGTTHEDIWMIAVGLCSFAIFLLSIIIYKTGKNV